MTVCPKCSGTDSSCGMCGGRGEISDETHIKLYGHPPYEKGPQHTTGDFEEEMKALRSIPVNTPRKEEEREYTTRKKKGPSEFATALTKALNKGK